MPQASADRFVTGLVLAAGGSSRLGRPKQLLPYGDRTLLEHVVDGARAAGLDQLVVALGGSAEDVLAQVSLGAVDVVVNREYTSGCSSSVGAAIAALDPRCEVLVLMLGDQPGVAPEHVRALVAALGDAPLAVCRYDDGPGHPLAFSRTLFRELAELRGDKAVWKLLDRHAGAAAEVRIASPTPRDVDTWADYEAVLAAARLPAPVR
jgi:molybdenum cofactor cytidylyltransferase